MGARSDAMASTRSSFIGTMMGVGFTSGSIPSPSISYAGSPFAWTYQSAISTANVSNVGGTVTSYAVVSGALPTGVSLNASTGALTGTPTAWSESGSFTIRATGPGGTSDAACSYTMAFSMAVFGTGKLWLKADGTLWQDSGRTTPVTADDQLVGAMDDLSGNSKHAVQTTAGKRQRYRAALGGYVQPDGDTGSLETPAAISSASFTWFVLYDSQERTFVSDSYAPILGFGIEGDASDGGGLFIKDGKSALYLKNGGGFDSYDGTGAASYAVTDGQCVLEGVHTAGGTAVILKDGVVDGSCSIGATLDWSGKFAIGGHQSGPAARQPWRGGIREVLVFDGAMSSGDRTKVRAYLAARRSYAASYFLPTWTNATTGALRGMVSANAKNWLAMPTTFAPASVIGTGDYSPLYVDGTWYLVYSNTRVWLSNTQTIGIASSSDLKTWTEIASIAASGAPTPNYHCGGPDWFVDDDGSKHVIFQGVDAAGTSFQFLITHPTNAGMTTWATPVPITWTSPPASMIDAFLVSPDNSPLGDGKYVLWYKNETTKYTEYATASAIEGPYTIQQSGDWMGLGSGVEGACLIKIGSTWRMYVDRYNANTGLAYSDSTDGWATWSALTAMPGAIAMATGMKHGTPAAIP